LFDLNIEFLDSLLPPLFHCCSLPLRALVLSKTAIIIIIKVKKCCLHHFSA
jgi:hypothetical protein